MVTKEIIKIGSKVTYRSHGDRKEKGIIKSFADDGEPFVVYYCGNDWKNYKNYTGAKTPWHLLEKGWTVK